MIDTHLKIMTNAPEMLYRIPLMREIYHSMNFVPMKSSVQPRFRLTNFYNAEGRESWRHIRFLFLAIHSASVVAIKSILLS